MATLKAYQRRLWRASLTADAILSAAEAAEALPGPAEAMLRWLVEEVCPVGEIDGMALYRWGDVVDALRGASARPSNREPAPVAASELPITTWRAVAQVLGMSEDTVARHRRDHGDPTERAWFADAGAVVAWWRKLHEPPPLRRTAR